MTPILDDAAARHLEALATDQRGHVSVVAPGGYGKTTLLHHLAAVLGAAVHTGPFDQVTDDVLVVDDAHLLDDADLAQLRDAAARTRLVVAARPWPRPAALAELLDLAQEQLIPAPFTKEQVRACLPAGRRTDALAEFVHTETGGVPGFVDRLARTLGPDKPGTKAEVPVAALAEFRPELARLDNDVLRFMLAADAGVGLHLDLLVDLLDRDAAAVGEIVEAARSTGLVGTAGALLPIARRAIRALVPVERRAWMRQRLAELQLARGGQVLALVRPLLGTGIGGAAAATAFEAAAAEALPVDPALSARLYEAAVTAGRPPLQVAALRAEALALAGDLDGALRLADEVITTESAARRRHAAGVAAAALAHRGQLFRSAQLYRWSGTEEGKQFASLGLLGIGDLADAREVRGQASSDGPPTSLSSALTLMSNGLHESVAGTPTTALSMMVRASGLLEPVGRGVLLPDSPAALGALLALHYGELSTASSLVDRAVAAGTGGAPLATRHQLLRTWITMVRGNLTAAAEQLTALRGAHLEPRDWLFAVAIELGVARRAGDTNTLGRAWLQAGEALLRHPMDLFTILPLGELMVAAARLREEARLSAHLDQARTLLKGLGNPPLWATPLWWGGLHAAVIADEVDVAEEHVEAMERAAAKDEQFGMVAAAGRCWVELMAGKVDPDAVEDASRGLHAAGFTWDAARLAGRAATRTSDRKAMVRLLDCARLLQGKPVAARTVPDEPRSSIPEVTLSERELQVAELVVSGMTYKDVGDRLFISAKTVEHHVARMRQRLGASSRSELLSQLRTLVGSPGAHG
ncbi:helix-turn-helix transcriptional regulator [Actinophytocola algeriensis]|uniref:DNA-binding CsgD family transcriptional regulator n=1 Tax=Actinophytocola algeriensis TaxID=1768010 RepID=A0A7W7VBS0_9PSEU|nr:helix-turn-helix transcriptional regulator [Actinophytocola algeriensis]MBB4904305.1 DNA-binding CsgD family transcriptional regulator [Actinophytocola algeriensis]MBE1476837.1 DNA-binding CsgD family transcriptional regulator [Actinophytocola algeriensis]